PPLPPPPLAAGADAAPGRSAGRRLAPHPPPLVRDAPSRGRSGPAGGPGAPRPREPRDHPGLHPRLAGTPPIRVRRRPPPRVPPPGVTSSRALARAGLIVSGAFLISRVLGWVRVVVIVNGGLPGADLDAFFAAFRLPDLVFQLVAAGAL